ncbi:hypothetical protein KM540_gp004 [Western grey kangaroopox virus]|uniref:Uncharacterized protein n=1 Tax=Western grey kangaroopox virus TaxID=1566307 RepID=A0A2C9DSF2_9POXV|nr:hypothetical protein KM540_gp004 [Western grey kangaroopox virus]ATI20935.1 hypothetical protein [Western grey kangaroopox virus]
MSSTFSSRSRLYSSFCCLIDSDLPGSCFAVCADTRWIPADLLHEIDKHLVETAHGCGSCYKSYVSINVSSCETHDVQLGCAFCRTYSSGRLSDVTAQVPSSSPVPASAYASLVATGGAHVNVPAALAAAWRGEAGERGDDGDTSDEAGAGDADDDAGAYLCMCEPSDRIVDMAPRSCLEVSDENGKVICEVDVFQGSSRVRNETAFDEAAEIHCVSFAAYLDADYDNVRVYSIRNFYRASPSANITLRIDTP